MDDVARVVGSGGILIAEACNGFGKTVSALSSLVDTGKPLIYATRTHDQVRQILAEVERINSHSGANYTAVNLASRDHLCLNPDCRSLPSRDATELCGMLRKSDECPFKSEITETPPGLPSVLSQEHLIQTGRRLHICPYFLARRCAKTRRVVVAPYPYIFDPRIRLMTGIDLEGHILVLDEGHNVEQVAQETFSDTLSDRSLASAGDELKSVAMSRNPMRKLSDHLAETVGEEPKLVKGEDLQDNLESTLGTDIPTFLEEHSVAVEAIREKKQRAGEPPICFLNGVLDFLELLSNSRKDLFIAVYKHGSYGTNLIEYRCLDPSLAIKPIVESASGTLIMSGTLSPLPLFADIIGLRSAEFRSYSPIQRSTEIRMVIDARVSTAYKDRSPEMMRRIGVTISEALPSIPNGALLFFTQRDLMQRCLDAWGTAGIIKTVNSKPILGGKPLYREGSDAKSNQEAVARYKSATVTMQGAALACVFRGRNSEGSNFPDDQCRGIFLVGVPYANYSDPLVRAQIAFYDRRTTGLGNRWYTMDAFRAANQALGRGIRSRDDWCKYWLLDHRYAQNENLISNWAKGAGSKIIRNSTEK
jgi:Rad3-related DNA helicase